MIPILPLRQNPVLPSRRPQHNHVTDNPAPTDPGVLNILQIFGLHVPFHIHPIPRRCNDPPHRHHLLRRQRPGYYIPRREYEDIPILNPIPRLRAWDRIRYGQAEVNNLLVQARQEGVGGVALRKKKACRAREVIFFGGAVGCADLFAHLATLQDKKQSVGVQYPCPPSPTRRMPRLSRNLSE